MRKLLAALVLFVVVCINGCAVNHYMRLANPDFTAAAASPGQAQIVFISDAFGPGRMLVMEVAEKQLEFVSFLPSNGRFLHNTIPGKHIYLADGEFGYFMEADVEAGKTYYAYVTVDVGWWRPRVQFVPVTQDAIKSDAFEEAWARSKWYENTEEGYQMFKQYYSWFIERYAALIQAYPTKRAETPQMLPEYGIVVPVQ